jgi:hypothetical protein
VFAATVREAASIRVRRGPLVGHGGYVHRSSSRSRQRA